MLQWKFSLFLYRDSRKAKLLKQKDNVPIGNEYCPISLGPINYPVWAYHSPSISLNTSRKCGRLRKTYKVKMTYCMMSSRQSDRLRKTHIVEMTHTAWCRDVQVSRVIVHLIAGLAHWVHINWENMQCSETNIKTI